MGIVVCLTMLFTLAVLRPSPWNGRLADQSPLGFYVGVTVASAVFGAWNAFYGLLNLFSFWGASALVSGLLMLCSSLVLILERSSGTSIQPLPRLALVFALLLVFLLYAITLVQINLGLTYFGQD